MSERFFPIIGLEIHVQLLSELKLFCRCKSGHDSKININTCPVCLGEPGALPVPNRKAMDKGIIAGIAFGSLINDTIKFDRKSYFYHDLPKGYQITQYEYPIAKGGNVKFRYADEIKSIDLTRMHIEEDSAKSFYNSGELVIDYNRAGIPLLEIVTEPQFRDADEAYEFLRELKRSLIALNVSNCNMEKGELRCDVNVSLSESPDKIPERKVEIKNLNSFSNVKRAIQYEIVRQSKTYESRSKLNQETRSWDEENQITSPMRSKETISDYRYIDEANIKSIHLDKSEVEEISNKIASLPIERFTKFIEKYGIESYDADIISSDKYASELFIKASRTLKDRSALRKLAKTIHTHLFSSVNDRSEISRIAPEKLAESVELRIDGKINENSLKILVEKLLNEDLDIRKFLEENEMIIEIDSDKILESVRYVLSTNPDIVQKYKHGYTNAINIFIGEVMKKMKGKADPRYLPKIISDELEKIEP